MTGYIHKAEDGALIAGAFLLGSGEMVIGVGLGVVGAGSKYLRSSLSFGETQ